MRRLLIVVLFVLALVPVVATAQMMGGGMRNPTAPMPPQTGVGPSLLSGMMGDVAGMGSHRSLFVGPDGTVYTLRVAKASTSTSPETLEVVAVRATGTIAWTAPVSAGMTFVQLSGDQLLVSTSVMGFGRTVPSSPSSSSLVALSTASGSEQWKLQLDGFTTDLEPFANGTYVTVVKPPAFDLNGGMQGSYAFSVTRTLLAVGRDGKILWSIPLTK